MRPVLYVVGVCLAVVPCCSAQEKPKTQRTETAGAKEAIAPNADAAKLPVRRVVLYKNGIGYFEHLGRVNGNQDVHIDFTSAQLNDVLKSLTVLDLSGGRITGVDYNSEAPLARRLATLRLALGEKPTESQFLGALRGARIEVRSGTAAPLTGKLLSVERKTRTGAGAGWTVETDEISLITDNGEVRSVDLSSSTSVRILDRDLNAEVGKYLGLVAAAREQDVRRMTISTTGTGERNLYVSYISEVPIWKTTYRIVLPSTPDKKPLLQGWAIVDNTVGEDWNDVELSLVAGAPHSFIQQLSEPYYGRRPVVELPQDVQLSPQTHGAALTGGNGSLSGEVTDPSGADIAGASVQLQDDRGNVVAQTVTDSDGGYEFSSLAPGRYGVVVSQAGFRTTKINGKNVAPGENELDASLNVGTAAETVEVTATPATVSTMSSALVTSRMGVANRPHVGVRGGAMGGVFGGTITGGNVNSLALLSPGVVGNALAAEEAAANGQGLGDLFEYKLKDRVTLKKNQSALVPIAQTAIEAEKVSLWSGTSGAGRPLRALWIKNTSPLTLDGGSFSVLEKEVFAGEGLMEAVKPGERRLLSYATDLGVLVEAQRTSQPQHVTLVSISKGVMRQTCQVQQKTVYTARNQEDTERTLVIEHPAQADWKLTKGTKEPEEKAPGVYRFEVKIEPKATASLPVEESRTLVNSFEVSDLTGDQIGLFARNGTITPQMKEELDKITAQKAVVAKLEQEMEDRQKDIDRIVADQERLRENMKALKGSAEEKALLQRYTKQLDDQETQLATLRKTIQDAETKRDAENDKLDEMIEGLNLEAQI